MKLLIINEEMKNKYIIKKKSVAIFKKIWFK